MPVVVTSAVTACVTTGLVIALLRGAGILDVANERSSHSGAVPRGGGIGLIVGFAAGVLVAGLVAGSSVMLLAALLLGLVGLVDDLRSLPALLRLLMQLAVGLAASCAIAAVSGAAFGPAAAVALIGTIWFAGFVNAFNFMDGINGVSGLSAAIAGGWYAWVGVSQDVPGLETVGLALAGAAIGFLPWNLPTAWVFLGDVGSYAVGAIIATAALLTIATTGDPLIAVAPCAVYAGDTAWTLVRRKVRGESLTTAHRDHAYQRLVDQWGSHTGAALAVAGCSILLCILAAGVRSFLAAPLGVLVVAVYLSAPRWAGRSAG